MSGITKRENNNKMCCKEEDSNNEMRRGPWTLEEDSLLIHYIARHGEGRWNMLAKSAGLKRNGKSCRLRWLNYLKPDIKRGNLTPQEQLMILELHSRWGNRWSKIAQHLPGRTDNEIKNYWRTRVQKQARQLNIESGSKKFMDAIRCFWTPGLVGKAEQHHKLNSPSPTSYSCLTTDTNFNNHVSPSIPSSPLLSSNNYINNNSIIPNPLSCSSSSSSFHQNSANFPTNFPSDSWQYSQVLEPPSSEVLPESWYGYMLENNNNNNASYSSSIQGQNLSVMNNMMTTTTSSSGYYEMEHDVMNQQEPNITMMESCDMLPFEYYCYQPITAESDWTLGNMADTLWNMEAL